MSGGSVGTNVRDAACFGIWALARRYASSELLAIPTHSVFAAKAHPTTSSILQVLATELVVTASLDPAGNIRRGASAALQELAGEASATLTLLQDAYLVPLLESSPMSYRTSNPGTLLPGSKSLFNC
ncbi:hypothetical protein LB505_003161 [Fusarium chuoi]|nr:hypothetical protein LB505_003161 [Fusarium chuoi]